MVNLIEGSFEIEWVGVQGIIHSQGSKTTTVELWAPEQHRHWGGALWAIIAGCMP
jgi:hypothetical protein